MSDVRPRRSTGSRARSRPPPRDASRSVLRMPALMMAILRRFTLLRWPALAVAADLRARALRVTFRRLMAIPPGEMPSGSIRLYNTLTQKLETFEPMTPGVATIYACGLTTYDLAHAGHGRTCTTFDVLTRHLRARGYKVTFVRNVTDVDDK